MQEGLPRARTTKTSCSCRLRHTSALTEVYLLFHDLGNSEDVEIVKLFYPRWRETPDGVKKGALCINGKRTEEQLICSSSACGALWHSAAKDCGRGVCRCRGRSKQQHGVG